MSEWDRSKKMRLEQAEQFAKLLSKVPQRDEDTILAVINAYADDLLDGNALKWKDAEGRQTP